MSVHSKQNEDKGGINPVVAMATGAIVGAGVAVAGAVALSDKKNRDKVKVVLSNVTDRVKHYMKDNPTTSARGEAEEKPSVGK